MATNLNYSVYSRVRGVKNSKTHLAKFNSRSAALGWASRYSAQCHNLVTVLVYNIDGKVYAKFKGGALA